MNILSAIPLIVMCQPNISLRLYFNVRMYQHTHTSDIPLLAASQGVSHYGKHAKFYGALSKGMCISLFLQEKQRALSLIGKQSSMKQEFTSF